MKKLNSLQILRAIAALSVLVTHVFQNTNYKPFGDYFLSGQYGVDIFFILSGFLIYLTVKENTVAIVYARKRLFRIYPLYIFAFLLYAVTGTGKYLMGDSVITYIQNITMFPWSKPIGYSSLIVGVAWSAVFEVFFYSLFFLLILSGLRKKWILIILPSIFVISQVIVRLNILPDSIPVISFFLSLGRSSHLLMFLVGCFISEFFSSDSIPRINTRLYNTLLFLSIFCSIIMMLMRYNSILSFLISPFLFITLVECENYHPLNTNKWHIKTLIHWGDISYSIYLLHLMVVMVFIRYLNVTNTIILLLLVFGTTILLASLTYKWIEKPFIGVSKKMSK